MTHVLSYQIEFLYRKLMIVDLALFVRWSPTYMMIIKDVLWICTEIICVLLYMIFVILQFFFLCYCSNNAKYRSALCSDRCCTRCWSLCCYQPYRLRLSWYELTHLCFSTLQASVRISVRLVDAATLMALPPPASIPNLVR